MTFMNMKRAFAPFVLGASFLTLAACSQPQVDTENVGPATTSQQSGKPLMANDPKVVAMLKDFGDDIGDNSTIYFDTDQNVIRADQQGTVDKMVEFIKNHADVFAPGTNVTIELAGYTDERGTENYNLALSKRRVQAVHDALTGEATKTGNAEDLSKTSNLSAALKTTAFGKEGGVCTQHNEDCWKQNRRVTIRIIVDGKPMTTPANAESKKFF